MKNINRVTNLSLAIVLVVAVFSLWYKQNYSMGVIFPYDINSKSCKTSVLIATQESNFKDDLTYKLIHRVDDDEVYIQVMDVTGLMSEDESDYDAIFIIHTWEMSKPPSKVSDFIDHAPDKSKIYTIGTSGSGDLMLGDVDGISTASTIKNMEYILEKAIRWYLTKVPLVTNEQTLIY